MHTHAYTHRHSRAELYFMLSDNTGFHFQHLVIELSATPIRDCFIIFLEQKLYTKKQKYFLDTDAWKSF